MKLISSTLLATLLASTTFALAGNASLQTTNINLDRIEVAQSAAAEEIKKKAMMLAEEAKKATMMAEEAEKKAMMAAEGDEKKKAMMMAEETKKKAMMATEEAKKAEMMAAEEEKKAMMMAEEAKKKEMMAAEEDKKAMMMAEEEKKKALMMATEEAKKKEMMAAEEDKKAMMMAEEEEDKKAMMMAVEACDAADFAVTGFGNATAAADSIADVVMKVKELSGDASCAIEITGYSSKSGPKSVNMALSEERAEWVKGELMSAGVDLSHTMVKGAGETAEFGNSSANRRVVISVK